MWHVVCHLPSASQQVLLRLMPEMAPRLWQQNHMPYETYIIHCTKSNICVVQVCRLPVMQSCPARNGTGTSAAAAVNKQKGNKKYALSNFKEHTHDTTHYDIASCKLQMDTALIAYNMVGY